MSGVLLRYMAYDAERHKSFPDIQAAIDGAIEMARNHSGDPRCIVTDDAYQSIVLHSSWLKQNIDAALGCNAQASQKLSEQYQKAREAIDRARYQRRLEAMQELPDWGAFG
jgi:hypothetical protein